MSKRITYFDIAQKAGVHKSTVGLAFQNSSRIPEETKNRILKVAHELGYEYSQQFGELMSNIKNPKKSLEQINIAIPCLVNCKSYLDRLYPDFRETLLTESKSNGINLTPFYIGKDFKTFNRLKQIIKTRAIKGVFLFSNLLTPDIYKLNLSETIVVSDSNSFSTISNNQFINDHTITYLSLFRKIVEKKYSNIGVIIPLYASDAYRSALYGALKIFQTENKIKVKTFNLALANPHEDELLGICNRINRELPQLIVSCYPGFYTYLEKYLHLKIPHDISYIECPNNSFNENVSGLRPNYKLRAKLMVRNIIQEVKTSNLSIIDKSLTVNIQPTWFEGKTFPTFRQ